MASGIGEMSPDAASGRAPVRALDYTGERMVPEEAAPATFWEHLYRYRFAAGFVRGQRVLDIACGEGYGTAALTHAGAASIIGIDLSEEACLHARRKYAIDARPGSAEAIPLSNNSIDLIVSFETIEHLDRPEHFLDECLRILAPGGTLIISTPNRDVYRAAGEYSPFHHSELSEDEFITMLRQRFSEFELYVQRLNSAAWWSARSFAAIASPWLKMRGMWRLRELLRRALSPHLVGTVRDAYRRSPSSAILAKDRPSSSLVNPYAIWKRSPATREQPEYIIAVARK